MQTFLPYEDFEASAKCLDNKRLNKQIVETLQIYNVNTKNLTGWKNHPAVKMWTGYEICLLSYGCIMYLQWQIRFNKIHKSGHTLSKLFGTNYNPNIFLQKPKWLGNTKFHASHRSNLLRKDPVFYGKYGWQEQSNLPYIWPTKDLIC